MSDLTSKEWPGTNKSGDGQQNGCRRAAWAGRNWSLGIPGNSGAG